MLLETRSQKSVTRTQLGAALTFALLVAAYPCARACYLAEVSYNEGWNVYNSSLLTRHQLLYPVRYGWTSVNYPMLWFVLLAQLHRLTHDTLFTARCLSLLGLLACCALCGAIVRTLGASARAAWLTGLFSLALFAAAADQYIGMADPQLFALAFFLAALWLYVERRDQPLALAAVALLFVLGGSIKHNPVDIPLAVFVDLCVLAPRRAAWFATCGLCFTGLSLWLNLHYGGPFFVTQLLAPRGYSVGKAVEQAGIVLGPLLLPLAVAVFTAFRFRQDPTRRIAAILLATSLAFGLYFSGGSGVAVNAFVSIFLAIVMLCGLTFEAMPQLRPALFAWLLIPWLLVPRLATGDWNPFARLAETRAAAQRFSQETALLRSLPGPALCESLLLCAYADKPYLYDPFNATRLVALHKLDPAPMLDAIHHQRFAAVQFNAPLADERHSERFDPALIEAIAESYQLHSATPDGELYTPRRP